MTRWNQRQALSSDRSPQQERRTRSSTRPPRGATRRVRRRRPATNEPTKRGDPTTCQRAEVGEQRQGPRAAPPAPGKNNCMTIVVPPPKMHSGLQHNFGACRPFPDQARLISVQERPRPGSSSAGWAASPLLCTQRIPALVIASDTFTSRLVGAKGTSQHQSPSHETRMPSLNLV